MTLTLKLHTHERKLWARANIGQQLANQTPLCHWVFLPWVRYQGRVHWAQQSAEREDLIDYSHLIYTVFVQQKRSTDLEGALWCCSHCSPTLTERTRNDRPWRRASKRRSDWSFWLFLCCFLKQEQKNWSTAPWPVLRDGASIKVFIFHVGKSKRSTIIQKTNIKWPKQRHRVEDEIKSPQKDEKDKAPPHVHVFMCLPCRQKVFCFYFQAQLPVFSHAVVHEAAVYSRHCWAVSSAGLQVAVLLCSAQLMDS